MVPVQGLHGPCFDGFVNCCVFDAVRAYVSVVGIHLGASFPPFQCAAIGTAYFFGFRQWSRALWITLQNHLIPDREYHTRRDTHLRVPPLR